MSNVGLLSKIFHIYFKFPNANIIHTVIEKMIIYILNRTVSEFHPYWAYHLFVEMRILDQFSDYLSKYLNKFLDHSRPNGPILLMITNFCWFIKELQEKMINQSQGIQNV